MFRPLQRKKQEIALKECLEILKQEKRGVLSILGENGYPYGVPINHYYSEEDGCLYFHGGKNGHKLDAIAENNKASYCVLDEGQKEEGGWALHFRSVIVFGKIEMIDEEETVRDIAYRLSRKFTDDEEYIQDEMRRTLKATAAFRLIPEHISGKRVNES